MNKIKEQIKNISTIILFTFIVIIVLKIIDVEFITYSVLTMSIIVNSYVFFFDKYKENEKK